MLKFRLPLWQIIIIVLIIIIKSKRHAKSWQGGIYEKGREREPRDFYKLLEIKKTKFRFLSIFVLFCGVTSVAKSLSTCPQLVERLSSPETLTSVECEPSSTILNFL